MAALGCLDLEPPPSTRYLYSLSGCTARRGCAASSLTRPAVAIFTWTPFEMHASLTSLGLVSRLVATDLTPNFAFPPVPDYHPRYRESCWAQKALHYPTSCSNPLPWTANKTPSFRSRPGSHGRTSCEAGVCGTRSPFSRFWPAYPH